jgi:hypothetical protein
MRVVMCHLWPPIPQNIVLNVFFKTSLYEKIHAHFGIGATGHRCGQLQL